MKVIPDLTFEPKFNSKFCSKWARVIIKASFDIFGQKVVALQGFTSVYVHTLALECMPFETRTIEFVARAAIHKMDVLTKACVMAKLSMTGTWVSAVCKCALVYVPWHMHWKEKSNRVSTEQGYIIPSGSKGKKAVLQHMPYTVSMKRWFCFQNWAKHLWDTLILICHIYNSRK